MNSPTYWAKQAANYSSLSAFVADFQRDAREGMVPAEDVRPLIAALEEHIKSVNYCFDCERAKKQFLDKHPNLFTI